jgi:hypothetical protein
VIANESKKEIERKLTLGWYTIFGGVLSSLMGSFPLSTMALRFSPLEREEKM